MISVRVVFRDKVNIFAVDCLDLVNFLNSLTLHVLVSIPDSIELTFQQTILFLVFV